VSVIDDDLGWHGCMWSLDHSQVVFGNSVAGSGVPQDHRRLCVGEWGYEHYHMLPTGVGCAEVEHLDTITELQRCSSYALAEYSQASLEEHALGAQGCWYFEATGRVVFSPSGASGAAFADYRSICLGIYQIYPEAYTVAARGATCADISLTALSDRKICLSYALAVGLNFSDTDQVGLYGCMYFEPVGQVVFGSAALVGQPPRFSDYRSVCEGSTTTTTGTTLSSTSSTSTEVMALTVELPEVKTAGAWQMTVVLLFISGGLGSLAVLAGCMMPKPTRGPVRSLPSAV